MQRLSLAAVALVAYARTADAEGWNDGPAGRHRIIHLVAIAVGSAMYVSSEAFLKDDLAPGDCRWCSPNALDRSVRDGVVWTNVTRAKSLSDFSGFLMTPALALSLTLLSSSRDDGRLTRVLDDTIPVVESGVVAALINQTVKFTVARRRPFVEFGDPSRPDDIDDNTSFYSGHTTLGFALTTAAGVVAHRRGSRLEPVIWATGYTLSVATGYLRMAADRHYLSDVLVGAAAGIGVGVTVPLAFHRNLQVIPARDGVTVAGTF